MEGSFFLRPPKKESQQENYGFKSDKNAPPVPELKKFEEDFIKIVENVQFKDSSKIGNNFQKLAKPRQKKYKRKSKCNCKGGQVK